MSAFRKVPTLRFVMRWSLYMVPVLLVLGILAVGIGAQFEPFSPPLEKPLGVDMNFEPPEWTPSVWPPVVARNHYERMLAFAFNFPMECLPGREINDFQVTHCAPFRVRFAYQAALSLVPLLVLLFGLFVAPGKIDSVYERGRMLVSSAAPGIQGTVTNPARANGDFFSWLYGLQTISVQLANGEQKVLYLPSEMPIPLPGQKFRCFNLGRYHFADRWTGILHAPHLAVVSGSR